MAITKHCILFILGLLILFKVESFPAEQTIIADEIIQDEILSIYKLNKEEGLREFIRAKGEMITGKLISGVLNPVSIPEPIEWLKILEIIAEEKNDKPMLAEIFFNNGKYYHSVMDYKKAEDYFDKTFHIYSDLNNLLGQAKIWEQKGENPDKTGQDDEAHELYGKALELYEKTENLPGQIRVLNVLKLKYKDIGKYERIFEYSSRLSKLEQKVEALTGMGDIWINKGEMYNNAGNTKEAIIAFDQAMPFFEKVGNTNSLAIAYEKKGIAYHRMGEYPSALTAYRDALSLYKNINNKNDLGRMYEYIGNIYFWMDNYSLALRIYEKALKFYNESSNLLGQATIKNQKSEIFSKTGNDIRYPLELNKAQKLADENQLLLNSNNNPYVKMTPDEYLKTLENKKDFKSLAWEYLMQGNEYSGLMNYTVQPIIKKALELFKKAMFYFNKIGDSVGQGKVYFGMGNVYSNTGQDDRALTCYTQAFDIAKKTGDSAILSGSSSELARIFEKTGKYEKALQQYDFTLSIHAKLQDFQWEAITWCNKAMLLNKMKKINDAKDCFEKCIDCLEQFRKKTVFSELKKNFFKRFYYKYEQIVCFMLENKFYDSAYKLAESMKTRVFLDQLGEGLRKIPDNASKETREKINSQIAELSRLSKTASENLRIKSNADIIKLKEEYQKKENELDDLIMNMRMENPSYFTIQNPEPVTVSSLQTDILKEGELLLHYLIAGGKIHVFLVSKTVFKVITLNTQEKELENMITNYLDASHLKGAKIESRRKFEIRKATRLLMNIGNSIYRSIVEPLESDIKENKNLIIIPDGKLNQIPFESFVTQIISPDKGIYLAEKYNIKYIQSGSILNLLRKQSNPKTSLETFAGFGDPVYDNKILGHLKNSCSEVESIARIFDDSLQKSKFFLSEDATEENARFLDLKCYDCIHFACHGILDEGFQGLVLSQLPNAREDGYLTLNEIMNCHFNAGLVVLSACKTGLGNFEKGEGVTGLTRAIMYAGTPAVVVSLWSVDDEGTKELMVLFYCNLVERGMKKEEALRQAKLDMIKNKEFASPYYWGAFVMYGE